MIIHILVCLGLDSTGGARAGYVKSVIENYISYDDYMLSGDV